MRFLFLTMDGNHNAALREAASRISHEHGVDLAISLYDATSLRDEADYARLTADAAAADFIFGSMLFGEEYVRPVQRALAAATSPLCVITSNPTLIRMTRLGGLSLAKKEEDPNPPPWKQWAQKFRGGSKGGHGEGQRQLAMLRNIGKIMAHIPGKARDLSTYIVVHQYWLHGSAENLRRMLLMLIERYVPGFQGKFPTQPPIEYPEVALIHPDADAPFATLAEYEQWLAGRDKRARSEPNRQSLRGTVGLLSLRTVALSGNTAHLDALHRALEARGLTVRMAYGAGLDFRPAMTRFFQTDDAAAGAAKKGWLARLGHTTHSDRQSAIGNRQSSIDLLINGAGFSLVGGMAESRPEESVAALGELDVPYIDTIPLAFQRVEEWRSDDTGLSPIQIAMNIAIPELDGAAEPLVFGGPTSGGDKFVALDDQIALAADRIAARVALRRTPNDEKRLAIVLFNFPPTLGNAGTAAYLDVFAGVYRLLQQLKDDGYTLDVPESAEALRHLVVDGGTQGTDGSVAAMLSLSDYRRLFPHQRDIEPLWGPAPGTLLNDGRDFYILGCQIGNIFIGLQPSFGYERDPMRLLMAKDAAPHHGFAAFYTWIEHIFGANAVLHFGTHGALEFMPGKQAGMSAQCWPTRLIGSLPNFYYYSVNNPSEATIAKRRGLATLVSHLTPPLQQAGLYKGLRALKDSIESYRLRPSPELLEDIVAAAAKLGINAPAAASEETTIAAVGHELLLTEQRMIPVGLHVLGAPPSQDELVDVLALISAFHRLPDGRTLPQQLAARLGYEYEALRDRLTDDTAAQDAWTQIDTAVREMMRGFIEQHSADVSRQDRREPASQASMVDAQLAAHLGPILDNMVVDHELPALTHAIGGGFTPPSPSNDVVRNPAVVPTGRNIHGLDPFRVPTPHAMEAGEKLVCELLTRLTAEQGSLPQSIALVLWGTDNLKSDGEGVAQALALLGARPVIDELGKVSDVELISLKELRRPRIDVVVTVSGIFRDLLSHQMLLIDRAARLAAAADEPIELNFVRRHALEQLANHSIGLDEASTRVFSNAPGSYGANVNHLVESGTWDDQTQLAEAFVVRKSFAFGARGQWREARAEMERALATVDATFQNIDSFEVGVSDIDHYYEYLGGVTKSVELLRGKRPAVFVAEALTTTGRLSTLEQIVRLESRAKLLNPKWYEGMLAHGYQGVREIETRVTNTYGWSATADAVDGWVYQQVAETFVLDEAMRKRLAELNPHAAAAIPRRLLEANGRGFWDADETTLDALREAYADLEDRMEGVHR